MNLKTIKKLILIFILLVSISLFLYIKFNKHNYEVIYTVEKFKIEECYENGLYTFIIKNSDRVYPYKFKNNYIRNKELINKIDIYKEDDETCILPISDNINFYPVCENNGELETYNLSDINIEKFNYRNYDKSNILHDKININYLNSANYLLYNYNGFYYVNDREIKEIKLFKNDIYTIDLIYQINEYILFPNYDDNHYFNKINVINLKNGKLKEIKLEKDISFDSVFLGDYKKNIYLLDKKEEKEYKINIKKFEIEEIEYTILKNKKLEKTTFKEIINNDLKFDNFNEISYQIIDNKLFKIVEGYKILITNSTVDKIIKEDDNTIYYLSNEKLFMYNEVYGEVLLISNFEWNFNSTNMIYIFK